MARVPLTPPDEFLRLIRAADRAYKSRQWIHGFEREREMWGYYRAHPEYREEFRHMAQRFNWLRR